MVTSPWALDLVATPGRRSPRADGGGPLGALASRADHALVTAWCLNAAANELVEVNAGSHGSPRTASRTPRRSPTGPDPGDPTVDVHQLRLQPRLRLLLRSVLPRAERRALGVDRVRRLVGEAVAAGVVELVLTGGEPFLLPDIDALVEACTSVLPTTLLTNGMLLHGRRLERLRRMDRERLALQISLDSANPRTA